MIDVLAWKTFRPRQEWELTLELFDERLERKAEDYRRPGNDYLISKPLRSQKERPTYARTKTTKVTTNLPNLEKEPTISWSCRICKSLQHKSKNCPKFREASRDKKLDLVIEHRLCLSCLETGHMIRECKNKKECGVNSCKKIHHPALHPGGKPETLSNTGNFATHANAVHPYVALGVIQVSVVGVDGRLVKVNALVDERSDTSMATESLIDKLGLSGKKVLLEVSGVDGKSRHMSQFTSMVISSLDEPEVRHNLRTWSLPEICKSVQPVAWPDLQEKWKHLQGRPLSSPRGKVDLLIGLDHSKIVCPLELRIGEEDSTYAVRTRLGWVARGTMGNPIGVKPRNINFLVSIAAPLDASAKNYTRQELLNNISRQINTLEKDDNEIHQLEGMDMDRLRNLSRRVENSLQYVFPIH